MLKSRKQETFRFIPAADLKRKYDVFGHFYSVEVSRRQFIECRSVLEIVEKPHCPVEHSSLSKQKPNAVVIMMNPGSSRPLVEVKNRVHADAIHELPISLVPTKPDTTQYQVMRLMHHCKWRHVRVLNLSDLRCSKSNEFFKQFKSLEDDFDFDSHSIFSSRRAAEFGLKMNSDKSIPIIVAWGVSDKLEPLIQRCTSKLVMHQGVMGLLKEGTTNRFLHPLPSLQADKRLWVMRMMQQLQK